MQKDTCIWVKKLVTAEHKNLDNLKFEKKNSEVIEIQIPFETATFTESLYLTNNKVNLLMTIGFIFSRLVKGTQISASINQLASL